MSKDNKARNKFLVPMLSVSVLIMVGFAAYSHVWTQTAETIRAEYPLALKNIAQAENSAQEPQITGYPGQIKIFIPRETIQNPHGSVTVENFLVKGWVFPHTPIEVQTGAIEVQNFRWPESLKFDSLLATFTIDENDVVTIMNSLLTKETFNAALNGTIHTNQEPAPDIKLDLTLDNHQLLLEDLGVKGIIEPRMALFMSAGLSALGNAEGKVIVPITQRDNTLFAGPLPIMQLGEKYSTSGEVVRETAAPPAPSQQSPAE